MSFSNINIMLTGGMPMMLIESIACYTGESRRRIEQILTDNVKATVAGMVKTPEAISNIDSDLLNELIEMDIFKYSDGQIKPNTAIFLEEDIKMLYAPIFKMGEEMADIMKNNGGDLVNSSPNIRNFIGSIMGMGQGLHTALKSVNLASNWQNKTGRYERSKVDFNEECQAYRSFGDDLQIKRIQRGRFYTSVIIGAGNDNYCSYLWGAQKPSSNQKTHDFYNDLVTYLTDTFPLLIIGKADDETLRNIAKSACIEVDDKSSVITKDDADKYHPVITKISEACTAYFFDNIEQVSELLRSTIVGQQGVPVKNMMMNFWRYLRRAVAIKLYENGFLNDKVSINGSITVFYENGIDFF